MEERELLSILGTAFIHLKKDINYKETKKKYQQALEEIAALIKKPKFTDKWVEGKMREMEQVTIPIESRKKDRESFIRSLIEEIQRVA